MMRPILMTAVAMLGLSTAAFAQSRPTTANQPDAGTGSLFNPPLGQPMTLGNPAADSGVAPPQQMPSGYSSPFFQTYDFPSYEANILPPAYANMVLHRQLHISSQNKLNRTIDDRRLTLEESEAYTAAQQRANEAHDRLNAARADALAPLMDEPEYTVLLDLQDTLSGQIADASADASPDMAKLRGMASLKLQYANAQREKERQYLQQSDAVASARDEVRAAGNDLLRLEREFRTHVRTDPQLADLRDTIEWLRIDRIVSGAYYSKARQVAEAAYEFNRTGMYRSTGQNNRSHGYGYGPYGYDLDYGFGTAVLGLDAAFNGTRR